MCPWNPYNCPDWDAQTVSHTAIMRLKRDITEIYKDPPPGVIILPNRDDITRMQAVITGPFDTPYEGGYFLFTIRCPPDYPIKPPRVRLMTTGGGLVRFNPNFYKSGKVCLSILGTWSGPGWSPASSLMTVLLSIQSLMSERPYHNEPGFAKERCAGDSERYNNCIKHETIRVAVCDMVEANSSLNLSDEVKKVVRMSFLKYFDFYITTCQEYRKLDGKPFQDPHGSNAGKFRFGELISRLENLKTKVLVTNPQEEAMDVD